MKPKLSINNRFNLIERALKGESVSKICKESGISRVIFYRWLKRYENDGKKGLLALNSGRPKKIKISEKLKPYTKLSPSTRTKMVEEVLLQGQPVTEVSKKYNVSRVTLYKWIKRYSKAKETQKNPSLVSKKPIVEKYWRQTPEKYEQAVLSIVGKYPEYGIRKILKELPQVVGRPIVGHHGVQNVLKRHDLSTYEARLVYAKTQITPVTKGISGIIDLVWNFFKLSPEKRTKAISFTGTFLFSMFASIVVFGMAGYVARSFRTVSGASPVGMYFATFALLMGMIFFLYSFKYYITLAIVLSFSQQEGALSGEGKKGKKSFLSWILGMQKQTGSQKRNPVGLEPNLSHVNLKKKPYISVQIPLYNEKNVVERSLEASTNFDYPEYEVILCDDSTDETTEIVRNYQKKHLLKGEKLKITKNKKEGWILTEVKVKPGVTLKHLHRTSRDGYKGKALALALTLVDPRTEFISVFDADFVPYPDSLELFLKYFKVQNNMSEEYKKSNVAVVQGYQWHVLNKSENWITRGIRSEYAGSYVIERSGTEIYGGLKQISGSVYLIRRDVLEEVGWESSITEDFELTLKLYEKGYKVVYTPYVQAPAECVSTLKRLIRQRMRWAEGHSFNVKKMFKRLMFNDKLSVAEKFEFAYLSPYYLQAFFFLLGTMSWLISETIFPARLPFWTELWGWSLVLTNMVALPLMNAVGLFLEESEERDYLGIASFVALSYILVPFQAYSSAKGFLQSEEGPWFRTPKTGRITDVFTRGRFYRFISGILPGKESAPSKTKLATHNSFISSKYLALSTANNRFDNFNIRVRSKRTKWIGKIALSILLVISTTLLSFIPATNKNISEVKAADWYDADWLYRKSLVIESDEVDCTSNMNNFPILINRTDADWADTSNSGKVSQADGGDIVFTDANHIKLAHEIEYYDNTDGDLVAWVEVPILDYNDDTTIYIYYGNDDSGLVNQWNINGTWDGSNYEGIWHLKETSAGSGAVTRADSTSNSNDLTDYNTTASGTGKIYQGSDHERDNSESLEITDANQIGLDVTAAFTISYWYSAEDQDSSKEVSKGDWDNAYMYTVGCAWGGPCGGSYYANGGWTTYSTSATTNHPLDGTWGYITFVHDGGDDEDRIYYNGSLEKTETGRTNDLANSSGEFMIGAGGRTSPHYYADGVIDEVRISSGVVETCWVSTEYSNQNNPAGFLASVGTEEEVSELLILLLPLAILLPFIVKYLEKRKREYMYA